MRQHRWIARLLTAAPVGMLLLVLSAPPATADTAGELSAAIPWRVSVGETVELTGQVGDDCQPGTTEVGFWTKDVPGLDEDFRDGSELVLYRPSADPGSTFTTEIVIPDLGVDQLWLYRFCQVSSDGHASGMTLVTIESAAPGATEGSGSAGAEGTATPADQSGTTDGGSPQRSTLFSEGRSNVVAAVPRIDETPWDLRSLLLSSLLAALVVLLVVFPSELFNSTLDEHYEEIKAAARRWVPWLRPRLETTGLATTATEATGAAAAPPRRGWAGLLAMTGASALLYGLLDPGFGPNLASVVLVIGVAAGVAVSTLLSAATTGWLVRRRFGRADHWFRVLPGTLVVAALCVAVSRLVGFLPGYLYGLVGGLAFRQSLDDDDQARTVLLASGAVMVAAVVGWFAYGPVAERVNADASPPWVVGESILAGTFIAGVEGLLFSLLPLRYLPGEKLFRWSRPVWTAVYGAAAFAFIHLIARPAAAGGGPAGVSWVKTLALFIVFGAASVAFWAYWRRRDTRSGHGATQEPDRLGIDGA